MSQALMCRPELFSLDLSGRNYVVTGASSGIGWVTAQQLAKQGAHVVLAVRDCEQGEGAASRIRAETPDAKVSVLRLDLASLASVREFARRYKHSHSTLHGLVNNAGVMNTPLRRTEDGFELQFGTNHLGHFLLTHELLDLLVHSAPARIVNLSSCYHDKAMGRAGMIHFDDPNYQRRKYDGWEAYAQSKLANLLHAQELAKRLQHTSVTAVSVHPGWVRTRLVRNSFPVWMQNYMLRPLLRSLGMIEAWQGAQTSLYALLAPEVEQQSGAFFSQTGSYRDRSLNSGGWPLRSPNPQAHDAELARRLWSMSEELVGLAAQPRASESSAAE